MRLVFEYNSDFIRPLLIDFLHFIIVLDQEGAKAL